MDAAPDPYAPLPLFVYGTLRPGLANHARFCADVTDVRRAAVAARLYRMADGFPVIVPDPHGRVLGELLTFPDPAGALRRIDPLEDVDPRAPAPPDARYERRVVLAQPLDTGLPERAWAYVSTPAHVVGATEVPGGDWLAAGGRGA